jgi:excisionase family DNA binding protein
VRDELTPREVAEQLGVTVRTVQRWIASGRLPGTRVGGRVRVPRSALGEVTAPSAATAGHGAPIRALLIANRGEIAVRVAKTARRLGMRVVRVHEADEPAPEGTDLALTIPSYLDGDAIVDAARRSGADAVHPGYGFLAENPAFAAAVGDAGLVWVGPPPDAITAMGDKAAARRLAAANGVPVVPGYDGPDQDDAALRAAAGRVGLPLLVKPAGGGGGKGMRVVRDLGELPEALAGARREALSAFGDDRLIPSGCSRWHATSRSRSCSTPTVPGSTSGSATAAPSDASRRSSRSRRRPRWTGRSAPGSATRRWRWPPRRGTSAPARSNSW